MNNLYNINDNYKNKYNYILTYLKEDNTYWLENDKWNLTEKFFLGKKVYKTNYIDFSAFQNLHIKNEIKYYLIWSFRENYMRNTYIVTLSFKFSAMASFFEKYYKNVASLSIINDDKLFIKWRDFLFNYKTNNISENTLTRYTSDLSTLLNFIKNFYDDREEVTKDIWNSKNIVGAKISATMARKSKVLNFTDIPTYYRDTVKRYIKSIVTKKSWSCCFEYLTKIKYFFNYFYNNGYSDGFLEDICREDIEKYIFYTLNDRKDKSKTETSKYIAWIRTFLEYIQLSQYDKSPKKDVVFLIFQDDIPKRDRSIDIIRKSKFIPEPILKQLDSNIMDIDSPQYIPIYILLRETGWRGTDILNLRYNNCLEQIWNNKEKTYNYYLCGEITKTGIAQLKIPIREKVAEMVKSSIEQAKKLSTSKNNPNKYLFNVYTGKLKGTPLNKQVLSRTIQRLIVKKDIRDVNGELYHFKLHSLRHTRAKEYVEQGMGISVVQQILGHQSLQMTIHYATVTENTLYEKWKDTEDLELFKVDSKTNELVEIDRSTDLGENLIRYEYVKKNLDAVRVPFGVCFKPSKLPCKQQMNHCLNCASFCTTIENIPEYEEEIESVKKQIDISERFGRELWAEKNKNYLRLLEDTLQRVREQKIIHKNDKSREEVSNA